MIRMKMILLDTKWLRWAHLNDTAINNGTMHLSLGEIRFGCLLEGNKSKSLHGDNKVQNGDEKEQNCDGKSVNGHR